MKSYNKMNWLYAHTYLSAWYKWKLLEYAYLLDLELISTNQPAYKSVKQVNQKCDGYIK